MKIKMEFELLALREKDIPAEDAVDADAVAGEIVEHMTTVEVEGWNISIENWSDR